MADNDLAELIGNQLERILSRPPLATSPSLSRMLRFMVEESLAGRNDTINELNLGLRVFNRGAEFNPRLDPIVRVQTHHLRSRLAQYYLTAGANDPVVIELPARTYVPVFRVLEQPAAAPQAEPKPEEVQSSRNPLAIGAVVVLVTLATVALLARPWSPARHTAHQADSMAQDLYIRGRYLLDRQTEAAMRQSVDCFQQATARDPQFAAAFAGLADARNLLTQFGYMSPRDGMEEARRAAQHALTLDPDLAEGHVALASILEAYDWDFPAAEHEYQRAIALNPALPAAHLWYGMFLRDQNRLSEALPEMRRAEQLEPFSVLANINLAYAFRMSGDLNAALDHARRATELNPELSTADVLLASIYRSRSDPGDADMNLTRALSRATGDPHALSILAAAYARLGRRQDSVRLQQQLEAMAAARYVSPYDLANVALCLGEEERAVNLFEEAYRQRSSGMIFLRNENADSVTHSPRLMALIRRMGNG